MGSVAVKDRGVAGTDLSRVVEDNDLGVERSGLLSGVVLGVGADVSSSDVLDGNVLHVETNVVSGKTLGDLLVVHLDGLDFGGDVGRSEGDDHTGLDDTDGDGLSHVSDGESSKGRVVRVRLDTDGLLGNELDNGGVSGLDELGGGLHGLTGSSVDLLDELGELAGCTLA